MTGNRDAGINDIVTRLRRWTHAVDAAPASDLMDEAADEIERLRRKISGEPMTDRTAGQRDPPALCIRDAREALGEPPVPCEGHDCYGCGRTFYCGEKHVCASRPQRCETGIERTPTTLERLAAGMKMLGRK